jgi:hypothetical protein
VLTETYTEAFSATPLHHTLSLAIGFCIAVALMLLLQRRKISAAIQTLNIEKNEQFKVAITSSFEEIVEMKRHYSELAQKEESKHTNAYRENYPKYVFYTQVYSYSLALQKHGWQMRDQRS